MCPSHHPCHVLISPEDIAASSASSPWDLALGRRPGEHCPAQERLLARGSYFCWGGSLAQHHLLGQVRHLLGVSLATATPQPGFPVQVGRAVSPLFKNLSLPLSLSPGDPWQVPHCSSSSHQLGICIQVLRAAKAGENLSLSGAGRGPKGAQTHVRSAPMENAARKGQDAGWAGELYGLVPVLPVSSAPAFLSLCSYRSSLQSVIERRLPQHHCARTAAVCARVPVRCWSLHTPPCPCPVGAMGYPCLPPQHPLPLEDKEGGEKVR